MNLCPSLDCLSALLRGEVSEARGSEIEDHLDRCGPCRARLHSLSDWMLSSSLPLAPLPGGLGLRSRALLDRLARNRSPIPAREWNEGADLPSAQLTALEGLPGEMPGYRGVREVGRGGMGTVY